MKERVKKARPVLPPPEVRIDPRGLRLVLPAQGGNRAYEGVLEFLISCDGSTPIPFGFKASEEAGPAARQAFVGSFPDPSAGFTCRVVLVPAPELRGISVQYEVENSGEDVAVRLEVRLHLPEEADPHWLIPGLFYGQNRLAHNEDRYPGYSEIKRDPANFWSNHWSFRSDRTSLPAVFCTSMSGTAYLSVEELAGETPSSPLMAGMTSLAFSSEDGQLTLGVSLPAIEEPVKAASSTGEVNAVAGSITLERGTPISWQFQAGMVAGPASEREGLLRALYRDRWSRFPLKPKVGSIEAEKLAIEGLCSWHLDPDRKVLREKSLGEREEVEARPFRVGERNGVFPAFVLLWYGRDNKEPAPVRVAHDLLDSVSRNLAPCGSFFEDLEEEHHSPSPSRPIRIVHARPVAEAVLFLIRAIRLEMQAQTPHPQWSSSVLSNLNFIVNAQREDGAFPCAWKAETGEVVHWEGCDGIAWIAPLAAAGQVAGSREWLDAARRGALHYRSVVEEGFITGALEYHEGIPTCSAAHWALISYILLYETDHDPVWLELARRAAEVALTWRMAYNIEFAPASMLAQYSISTMGGDIQSAATPVLGAWGLLSYGEMIRLSALTEDDYYEQRAREGRLFASQLLARTDGEFNLRRGLTLGPISNTDGLIPKGLAMKESLVWTNALITYAALIERNQMISREALAGDPQSLAEMALRASGVGIKPEMELPESVAARRSRDSGVQRVLQPAPKPISPLRPATPTPEPEREASTPVLAKQEETETASRRKRASTSGVVKMPSFPREIHEPRRSTDDSQATDERPAPLLLSKPAEGFLKSQNTPAPQSPAPVRVPGVPVGKDPHTQRDVFVASGVMGSAVGRAPTSRRDEMEKSDPPRPLIPVHRGYRTPVEQEVTPPKPEPPSSHEPSADKGTDLPKWHVYQKVWGDADSQFEGTQDIAPPPKDRPSKVPFEQRHSPLPAEDPISSGSPGTKPPTTLPVRPSDSTNPYRLPTGLEDNTPESKDPESPADPSRIKWKIF
jgi:hypothetical protein